MKIGTKSYSLKWGEPTTDANWYYDNNTTTTISPGDWKDMTSAPSSWTWNTGVGYPQSIEHFEELAEREITKTTSDGRSIVVTYWEVLLLKKYDVEIEKVTLKELSKYLVEIKL